jgi:predicted nuclease of predicted toxin-antitoxin system
MKLLLDENMPQKLRQHLPGHHVFSTACMKWAGIRNGELLALAAADGFDALLTVDAGIEYEQNLSTLPRSVVIIKAESNAFEHIEPIVSAVLAALTTLAPRSLVKVG